MSISEQYIQDKSFETNEQVASSQPEEVFSKDLHGLREKYWKKPSSIWPLLQIAPFIVALVVNFVFPTVQDVSMLPYRIFLVAVITFLMGAYVLTFINRKIKIITNHKSQFYFAVGIVLIMWDVSTTKSNFFPLPFFPSLAQILQVMVEDYQSLLISTLYSLRLLVFGFAIGTVLGLTTGVLIGWYKQWNYWLFPIIKVIGIVPAIAWIPVAMFIFPSSFYTEVFLIVICVWFPVAFMTSNGILGIQKSYFEAAKTLGGNERFLIFKVAIPGAMPSIFVGIYTAISLSFATLVISEMIGAVAGLGWYINWAKSWSNYAKVFASIIVMAIVFSFVMSVIFKIRDRVLIWQKGLLK